MRRTNGDFTFGPTPRLEPNASKHGLNYNFKEFNKKECEVYLEMLIEQFPIPDSIKQFVSFGISEPANNSELPGVYMSAKWMYANDDDEVFSFAMYVLGQNSHYWNKESLLKLVLYKDYNAKIRQ